MEAELLGAYWTTAGPVEIHRGREWSLFDWPDRCAAAANAGLHGLGIWHADLAHQLELRDLREIRRIFEDHGLRYLELEFLGDWFVPEGDPRRSTSDSNRAMLFDAAAELGAHHIKAGNIFGTPCELNELIDRFGELCADAARRHSAAIVYEFMPPDVNVPTLDTALSLLAGAGADNAGLTLDTWHLGKLGVTPEDLRRVPLHQLYVELSDGQIENMPDPVEETTAYRRLPGEGEFDLPGYIRVLTERGYPGPWGVEVLSSGLRALPMPEMFRRAYVTSMSQFRAARAREEIR